MLHKNTKAMVRSLGDTNFDIVAGVLQGDTLAPYLFIICQDYVIQTSIDLIKENGFTLKKAGSRRYATKTLMDADFANDQALLTNSPAQAESLLHSLEQAVVDINLYVNENKTEYMFFKQKRTISTLRSKPLKLVDQFTYLSSNISSTESDVKIRFAKA